MSGMFLKTHLAKIEAAVDQMVSAARYHKVICLIFLQISKIESQRDLTQIIVHVDMDAFYAVSLTDWKFMKTN